MKFFTDMAGKDLSKIRDAKMMSCEMIYECPLS